MSHSSELTSGLHFVWRTDRPFVERYRESPVFSFLNAQWILSMYFGGTWYFVYLHKRTEWEDFQPFEVTAWIEDDRKKSTPIHWQRKEVKLNTDDIWHICEDDLLKEIPDFNDYGDFKFVCMLRSASPSGLKKESKHKSIQVSLDHLRSPESTSLDPICPPRRIKQLIQAPLDFPPDIEGLSLDLGNLLEKDIMPDVQLKCGDGNVPAHRSVLIARSEVFAAMFRNDTAESRSGVVDMPDMDSEVLHSLLKYVYTSKFPEASEDLMLKLYAASNKFAIHGLKKLCSDQMTGGLNEENCLDYLVLADTHSDAAFKHDVASFIVDNQGVLLRSTAWFRFSKEQPILAVEVYHKCFER